MLAGFYLLRVPDIATATWCAVALNLAVALIALGMTRSAPTAPMQTPRTSLPAIAAPPGSRFILVAIALSGSCALGAEVVWARTLSLLLGATVYT